MQTCMKRKIYLLEIRPKNLSVTCEIFREEFASLGKRVSCGYCQLRWCRENFWWLFEWIAYLFFFKKKVHHFSKVSFWEIIMFDFDKNTFLFYVDSLLEIRYMKKGRHVVEEWKKITFISNVPHLLIIQISISLLCSYNYLICANFF